MGNKFEIDDRVSVGSSQDSHLHGNVVGVTWKKHVGPRYTVRFDDGQQETYAEWQLSKVTEK